jgi:hypothetical protein
MLNLILKTCSSLQKYSRRDEQVVNLADIHPIITF